MLTIDLSGKRGLVMGVANAHSLGWAIAEKLAAAGAELAFSYQGERLRESLEKLTAALPGSRLYDCDVTDDAALDAMFGDLGEAWGGLDYVVHAVAFAPRPAMDGRYIETTRADWLTAMEVSAYSLVAAAQRAEPLLRPGGGLVTLTYYAAEKVVPKYNVMGVAKSALEGSVRYLAYELGKKQVRVNAISAGPVRTLAGSGVSDARVMFAYQKRNAPLGRTVSIDEIGGTAVYLLSDLSSGVTGEVHFVDSGYNIIAMPRLEELKVTEATAGEEPDTEAAE